MLCNSFFLCTVPVEKTGQSGMRRVLAQVLILPSSTKTQNFYIILSKTLKSSTMSKFLRSDCHAITRQLKAQSNSQMCKVSFITT